MGDRSSFPRENARLDSLPFPVHSIAINDSIQGMGQKRNLIRTSADAAAAVNERLLSFISIA